MFLFFDFILSLQKYKNYLYHLHVLINFMVKNS